MHDTSDGLTHTKKAEDLKRALQAVDQLGQFAFRRAAGALRAPAEAPDNTI